MSKIKVSEFYTYAINFSSLGAGSAQSGTVNIEADSDFEIQKLTYMVDIAGGSVTASSRIIPLVDVTVTDQSSGRQLTNIAVPVTNIFGTGELPFILPTTKILAARAALGISVTNVSAGSTYNIKLAFVGRKIYR